MSLDAMEYGIKAIGNALHTHQLAVPVYQRSYAWTKKEVTELFQDISNSISKSEPEYFLGSIVVARKNADRPEVVDGQQRLATTIILLSAIRDYFHLTGDIGRAQDIENEYLQKKHLRTQEIEPKMRLNEVDNDFFIKRILSTPDSEDRKMKPGIPGSHQRIEDAAILAKEVVKSLVKVNSKPSDILIDWVDFIRDKAKVIWVSVPDYANAFTIFETLNDRGLDLATSDLLKNFLFGESGDRIGEAIQSWVTMTGTLEAVGSESLTVLYIKH